MANPEDLKTQESIKDESQEGSDLGNSNIDDSSNIQDYIKRISQIAESGKSKGIIQAQSYDFLKGLTSDPDIEKTLEQMCANPYAPPGGKLGMVKEILKHTENQYKNGSTALSRLEEAVRSGYITEDDKEFYIERIIQDPKFVSHFSEAEKIIRDKMEEQKELKEKHSDLLDNKLIKNGNELQVSEHSSVKIIDEKKFLSLKRKEKAEYIKKCEEDLKKAESYSKEAEKKESDAIDKEFKGIVKKFQTGEKPIIGGRTVLEWNKWIEGVKGVDAKREALKGMHAGEGGQFEKNAKLWKQIRENLQGDELAMMDKMRDKKEVGFTELFTEYGKIGNRLNIKYEEELNKYVQNGKITGEIKRKFMEDPDGMKNVQDIKTKYRYINELPNEIDKYLKTHKEEADDKTSEKDSKSKLNMSDPLSAVTDLTAKRAIQHTIDELKNGSSEQMSGFLRIVKSVTRGGQQSDNYDASGFQSSLRQKREERLEDEKSELVRQEEGAGNVIDLSEKRKESSVKRRWNPFAKKQPNEQVGLNASQINEEIEEVNQPLKAESRKSSQPVSKTEIKEEVKVLQEEGKAKMVDDRGFLEVQMQEERSTIVQINRSEARNRLLFENQKRQYKSEKDGGKDNITFAVKSDSGSSIELDMTKVRAMEKALEQEMGERKSA